MASTYSDLKFELIATGEQSGTWGATTNTNLGTAIEQAITGSVDITFASADVTLTLTDTNAAQNARALRLNLTGTSGGARNLIVPAIEKQYIVSNGLADAVTVKNSTGTGIAVPAGKTMVVFNNASNVVDVTTYASSLTLGAALPITSGGTGTTSTTFVNLASNVTGTLPVVNGGTGQTSYTDGQLLIGNSTGNTLAKSTLTAGSGVTITNGSGTITISATGSGGDAVLANNNAFTGANTFYNNTGQTIGTGTSSQDGLILAGRAGGSSSYRVTLQPGTLSASRSVTFPDANTLVPVATQTLTFSGPTAARTYTLPDEASSLGFRNIPAVADKTTSYSLQTSDVGRVVGVGSGGSITIPDATFAAGDAVLIFNNTTAGITITCTITTAYIAGTDADKATLTLATRGIASILFVSGTVCVVSGNVT
jgi:hypothetical protein